MPDISGYTKLVSEVSSDQLLDRVVDNSWPFLSDIQEEGLFGSFDNENPLVSLRRSYNQDQKRIVLLRRPDVIAFDLDGVLANANNFHEVVVHEFLKRHGINIFLEDLILVSQEGDPLNRGNRDVWHYGIRLVEEKLKSEDSRLSQEFLQDRIECYKEELRGIEKKDYGFERELLLVSKRALGLLHNSFPKMLLITNRDVEEAREFVRKNRLENIFSINGKASVYGRDKLNGVNTKPSSDMFLQAVLEHGLYETEIMMIGDSDTDLGPLKVNAARYGIRITPVGVLRPGHGYSLDCERKLFESEAIVVVPTAAHAIKDLLRADNLSRGNKKIPDYWKMKRVMASHHGAIEYLMGQKNGKKGSK